MTAVNSKPADPRHAKREELSTTDLRVEYMKHCRAYLIGKQDQLEAEGIPEISDKWPLERAFVRWEVDGLRFSMEEESRRRLKKLYGRLPEEPHYRVWIERSTADFSRWARAELLTKQEEMEEVRYRWSEEHTEVIRRAIMARDDARFMAHMGAIIGPTQPRKGGRPRAQSCD